MNKKESSGNYQNKKISIQRIVISIVISLIGVFYLLFLFQKNPNVESLDFLTKIDISIFIGLFILSFCNIYMGLTENEEKQKKSLS